MRKERLSKAAWEKKKQYTTDWIQNRCESDDLYRKLRGTRSLLSSFFRKALAGKTPKSKTLEKITGMTSQQLVKHLLATTSDIVTKDNYGSEFEIDHKIPIKKFQTLPQHLDEEEILSLCFSPSNLRILKKKDNRPGRVA